jgi:hypothetical protein
VGHPDHPIHHIVAISVALVSAFMIIFRVLGWTGSDQTPAETTERFWPWLAGSLVVLLVTGALMVVGEPARELLAFSFWLKMSLVVIGTTMTWWAGRSGAKAAKAAKVMSFVTLLIWVGIIFLGRLIAYDHIWGSWSMSPKHETTLTSMLASLEGLASPSTSDSRFFPVPRIAPRRRTDDGVRIDCGAGPAAAGDGVGAVRWRASQSTWRSGRGGRSR